MAKSVSLNDNSQWLLYLFSPFLAGIVALKNYRSAWAKNILWAFVVYFGATFGMAKENSTGKATADIFRYTAEVKTLYDKNLTFDQVKNLYIENEDIDILRLTLAIGVSRFTDSPKILIAIYGFIFGFFFSRNLWFILERLQGKIKPFTILLLLAFVLVNPFWNINGFRYYTAVHIFIYGLLPFIFEGKKKGVLISSFSFLVHFSFLIPIIILLAYTVIGNKTLIYFVFFLASIVTSEINISPLNAFIEARAPKALSARTASYRSEQQVKEFRTKTGRNKDQSLSWHAKFYMKALYWSIIAFLMYLFYKRKSLEQLNNRFLNSLSFTLFFWGLANLLSSLPSGGRYLTIACLSALPLIIFFVHYSYSDKYLVKLTRITIPALALFIIVSMRTGFYSLSLNTFIGNPIVALFTEYNFSINDLIK